MKHAKLFDQITSCIIALLLAVPMSAMAQSAGEDRSVQSSGPVYQAEELEQLLAPIALYPDALLAQVLTAATYPLEVVEAARFAQENQGVSAEALLELAADKDWEPSVKAMLGFPDLLARMDENLEWTGKLGDAFLVQQAECMEAVQRLRQKAYAKGNLTTNDKHVVKVEPETEIIVIEPANPRTVYVPVYDPLVIYGSWWYPAYPPYYFYPARYVGISFFVGGFWGSWGIWSCNWYSRHVSINVVHYNDFTRTHYRRGAHYLHYTAGSMHQPWKHYPRYRESFRHERKLAGVPIAPRASALRRHNQPVVRVGSSPARARENVRPAVRSAPMRRTTQTTIKKQSVRTPEGRRVQRVVTRPGQTVNPGNVAEAPRVRQRPARDEKPREAIRPAAPAATLPAATPAAPRHKVNKQKENRGQVRAQDVKQHRGRGWEDFPGARGAEMGHRGPPGVIGR